MARVRWLRAAIEDVDAIAAYIARDSPAYAAGMVRRFLAVARDLERFPEMGRTVPEWEDESVREVIIGNYRLIYLLRDDDIHILAVIHGARMLPDDTRERRDET